MASLKLCVCDRTRERLIGTKLDLVDTVHVPFATLVKSLSDVPDSGLWLSPFRGIPKGPRLSRFDVIYLDDEARVLDSIESFTVEEFEPLRKQAASALILPAHTLRLVNVQKGDQLRVCRAGKVMAGEEALLDGEAPRTSEEVCIRDTMPRDAILRDGRLEGPRRDRTSDELATDTRTEKRSLKEKFLRWLFFDPEDSDRRRGSRLPAPSLVAYYWTGGAPKAYKLGNVSRSGLYVFTEERWLPGTRIVMTLQKESGELSESTESEEITRVESEVVRWGEDGVAFQFVESGFVDLNTGEIVEGRKFDREAFEQFLHRVTKPNSHAKSAEVLRMG
jgi:hypothetical protein